MPYPYVCLPCVCVLVIYASPPNLPPIFVLSRPHAVNYRPCGRFLAYQNILTLPALSFCRTEIVVVWSLTASPCSQAHSLLQPTIFLGGAKPRDWLADAIHRRHCPNLVASGTSLATREKNHHHQPVRAYLRRKNAIVCIVSPSQTHHLYH